MPAVVFTQKPVNPSVKKLMSFNLGGVVGATLVIAQCATWLKLNIYVEAGTHKGRPFRPAEYYSL
ncbi:MAG TPA: hypothetical protein PKC70_18805, partial [Cellvibrionaceae bacterium]|nr:hypothetical protein [Cellvibrionaceae bacterium]